MRKILLRLQNAVKKYFSVRMLPDDSKEKLKNILTEDEYNAITKTQYVYRFKYLKFLNDWLQGGK